MSRTRRILAKYVPEVYVSMLIPLLQHPELKFKIVKPRKTKLGDFRVLNRSAFIITVNGDLNPYSFLITTLHEIAHFETYKKHGSAVAPHGNEWKLQFSKLLQPFIKHPEFPDDIQKALMGREQCLKASSCTDQRLQRILNQYDEVEDDLVHLDTISKNSIFALGERHFRKGNLRRTRFLCTEIQTNKAYLVNALARVKLIEKYDQ